MAVVEEIRVIVKAEVKDAIKNLKSYHKSSQDILKSMQRFAVQAIGLKLSVNAIKSAIGGSVQAFLKQQLACEKLSSAIRATGKESQISASQLEELAAKLQSVTVFGDETTIAAMSLLQGLANLDQRGLEKVTPAMQDFASAMGVDLEQAASLIGKTLSSTTNALSRYGIQIDTNLPKEEKLAQIVEQIEKKFSGMAETVGKTAYGSMEKFKNAMGDAQEWGGKLILHFLQPAVDLFTQMITKFNEIQRIRDILNNIGKGAYTVQTEIETLTGEIERLKRVAATGGELSGVGLMRELDLRQAQLDALEDTVKWTNAAKRAAKDRDLVAEEAAKKEAERAARTAEYLKQVADEYAKTPKAIEEALRATIKYWESIKRPSAEVVEILAMYRKQLEELTKVADSAADSVAGSINPLITYYKELSQNAENFTDEITDTTKAITELNDKQKLSVDLVTQLGEGLGSAMVNAKDAGAIIKGMFKSMALTYLGYLAAIAMGPPPNLKSLFAIAAASGVIKSLDRGGVLNEPVVGTGMRTGQQYGFALGGPEEFGGVGRVGRTGGGINLVVNGSILTEGELLDAFEGALARRGRGF